MRWQSWALHHLLSRVQRLEEEEEEEAHLRSLCESKAQEMVSLSNLSSCLAFTQVCACVVARCAWLVWCLPFVVLLPGPLRGG